MLIFPQPLQISAHYQLIYVAIPSKLCIFFSKSPNYRPRINYVFHRVVAETILAIRIIEAEKLSHQKHDRRNAPKHPSP